MLSCVEFEDYDEGDDFDRSVQKYDHLEWEKELEAMGGLDQVEVEDVLEELGLRRKKKQIAKEPPQNRYWLHDTPGAVNEAQVTKKHSIFHCVHCVCSFIPNSLSIISPPTS